MPSSLAYAVRNQSDDSVIIYATSQRAAERYAAEIRDGDFDNEPRECWIDCIDPDWAEQGG